MDDTEEAKEFFDNQYRPEKPIDRSVEDMKDRSELFFQTGLKAREKAIRKLTCNLDIKYTDGKNTKLDIYHPVNTKSDVTDVLMFIHGGGWTSGSKETNAFLAEQVNALQCVLIIVGHDPAPHESMEGIARQIKDAVDFTGKKFPDSRLFLCGHSSGAHLCAMMLSMDWDISIKRRLTGMCLIAGVYDLKRFFQTYPNEQLKITEEIATRNSPMLIQSSKNLGLDCRVLVVVAEHDFPELHRQSKEYYELLQKKLASVAYRKVNGVDHLDIVEKFVEEGFCLIKEIHDFIKRR